MTWVSSAEAATALQVTVNHVGWLGGRGELRVERHGRHRLVWRPSLERLVHERSRWITLVEAGRMLGVSSKTAQQLARRGLIRQRTTAGTRLPSIERRSVELYLGSS